MAIREDIAYSSPFDNPFSTGMNSHQQLHATSYGNYNKEEFLFAYAKFLNTYNSVYEAMIKKKGQMAFWTKEDFDALAKELDANPNLKKEAREAIELYQRTGAKGSFPEALEFLEYVGSPVTKHTNLSQKNLIQFRERVVNQKAELDPMQPYWEKLQEGKWKDSKGYAAIRSEIRQGRNCTDVTSEGSKSLTAIRAALESNPILHKANTEKEYLDNIAAGKPTYYREKDSFYVHYGKKSASAIEQHCKATLQITRKALQMDDVTVFDNIEKPSKLTNGLVMMNPAKKTEIEQNVLGQDGDGNYKSVPPEVRRKVDARMAVMNERGAYNYDPQTGEISTGPGYREVSNADLLDYQERYAQVLLEENNKFELAQHQTIDEGLELDEDENETPEAFDKRRREYIMESFEGQRPTQRENNIAVHQKVAQSFGYHSVKVYDEKGEFKELRVFNGAGAINQEDKELFDFGVKCEQEKQAEKRVEVLSHSEIQNLRKEINQTRKNYGYESEISESDFIKICQAESVKLGCQFKLNDRTNELIICQKSQGDGKEKKEELKQIIRHKGTNTEAILLERFVGNRTLVRVDCDMHVMDPSAFNDERFMEILTQLGFTIEFTPGEFREQQTEYNYYIKADIDPQHARKQVDYACALAQKEKECVVFKSGKIEEGLKSYKLTPKQLEVIVVAVAQENGLTLSYTEQQQKKNDSQIGKFTVSAPKGEMDQDTFIRKVQEKARELYPSHIPSANTDLFNALNTGQANPPPPVNNPNPNFGHN